jgi:hypothetical protein
MLVLPFAFRDTSGAGELHGEDPADRRRVKALEAETQAILRHSGRYALIDARAYRSIVDKLSANQDFDECHGCEIDIGQALGADQVLVGWVLKESNLLIYLGARIEDVHGAKPIAAKMVQIESDSDESWQRGINFVLGEMLSRMKQTPGRAP